MKFQKLTIHNIASIEDATIDFEAKPLSDSDVFLITGNTGAGKSTILDAICIVLYNKTPRMSKAGVNNDKDDDGPKYYSILQLVRRGCPEASVTLNFIGINGHHYVAKWFVKRARKKADGKLQPIARELTDLDTNITLTKEINKEIPEVIGLDFEQFCRTTMLAQGEFTKFLYSDDKEKADILEKITGVDDYSRIGAKIYEIFNEKKSAYTVADEAIKGIKTLSDEEISQKNAELALLDDAINKIKSETGNMRSSLAKSEQALKLMDEIAESRIKLNGLNDKLKLLASDYAEIVRKESHGQQILESLQREEAGLKAQVEADEDKKQIYANSQTITQNINNIHDKKKDIEELRHQIHDLEESLRTSLSDALSDAEKQWNEADSSHHQKIDEIDKLDKQLDGLGLENLHRQSDEIKGQITSCETANNKTDEYLEAVQSYEDKRKELENREKQLTEKVEEKSCCEKDTKAAKELMESAKDKLDKQIDSVNKFAAQLRTRLKKGDKCPVCGQIIDSELPDEKELEKLVEIFRDDFDKAEKTFNGLDSRLRSLTAEINTETANIRRESETLSKDDRTRRKNNEAIEAYRKAGLPEAIEALDSKTSLKETAIKITDIIGKKKAELEKSLKTIDDVIKEGDKINARIREERKVCDELSKKADKAKEDLTKARSDIDKCRNSVSSKNEAIEKDEKEIRTYTDKIDELVTLEQWKSEWKKSSEEFADRLTKDAEAYRQLVKELEGAERKIATKSVEVNTLHNTVASISALMPQWRETPADSTELTDSEPAASKSVDSELVDSKLAVESALMTDTRKSEHCNPLSAADGADGNEDNLEDAVKMANQLNGTLSATLESIKHTEELIEKNQSALTEALGGDDIYVNGHNESPDTDRCENSKVSGTEEVRRKLETGIEKLNQQIAVNDSDMAKKSEDKGAITQELATDKENNAKLGQLREEAERKKEELDSWAELNETIGDKTGSRFRNIAQSYVLSSLTEAANTYMRTLTDRYTLKVTPGTFIISVVDAYQGYVSRAASTISGGESFLVSLSLALALSDIGQGLGVNTLFIDEGFGTLSGEPLQNAISTLRMLHDKTGKHVGIISHIEELRERIPVQIQVRQKSGNSSSEVVVTEI